MTYQVHYESKPGMWERYTGVKEVEADGADGAIDKIFQTAHGRDGFLP